MDLGLKGKNALVLGASRGLGAACAKALAQEGAHVTALSRTASSINTWAKAEELSDKIKPVEVDLSDAAAVQTFALHIAEAGFDILVNNCGGPAAGPAKGQSAEAWRAAYDAMALPMFQLTDTVLPGMMERGFGRVITIGSSGVVAPIPNLAFSNAVRGAIAGWSKTLAGEVAASGVTVNMILPGRIGTDRVRELDEINATKTKRDYDTVVAASKATIPAGRYGDPDEFGAVAAFLASTKASYVTGAMVRVDGGMIRNL